MGLVFNDVKTFESILNIAISHAMQNDIKDGAISEIQDSMEKRFYEAYQPKIEGWYNQYGARGMRRMDAPGGMGDPDTMQVDYSETTVNDYEEHTITITLNADYQNVGFGKKTTGNGKPDMPLADYVQTHRVYHAPPRSFVPEAEERYSKQRFEKDLNESLRRQGLK